MNEKSNPSLKQQGCQSTKRKFLLVIKIWDSVYISVESIVLSKSYVEEVASRVHIKAEDNLVMHALTHALLIPNTHMVIGGDKG